MTQEPKQGNAWRPSGREIAAGILVLLGLIFVLENTRKVKIRFIIPEVTTRLWVALLVAILVGAAFGWLFQRRRDR